VPRPDVAQLVDRTVRVIFALVLVAACGAEPPPTGPALPSDAYYTQECFPEGCREQLGFCSDGTWSMLIDEMELVHGGYVVEAGRAVDDNRCDDVPGFTFDFATRRIVAGVSGDMPWQATTAVQDADVACAE
jgi:hypothetical protein